MLPEKVNIFGMEYTIRQDKDEYLEANNLLGEILYNEQEIYIKSTISFDRKVKVLVHEISHGILNEVGALKTRSDESIIDFISICLHHFLKNNDFDWIAKRS